MFDATRAAQAKEEVGLYDRYLARLANLWKKNGPSQFGEPLADLLADIETLARTTTVFSVETRLMALLYLTGDIGGGYDDVEAFHKVSRLISALRAMPSLAAETELTVEEFALAVGGRVARD